MRLGQLSRKISIRTNEIVALLAQRGVVVEDSFNARVEDEHVQYVISHFAPHLNIPSEPQTGQGQVAEPVESTTPSDVMQPVEPSPEPQEAVAEDEHNSSAKEVQQPSEEGVSKPVESGLVNEVNGVIKAPKVELQGLKVLGKIELPEPKKKETGTEPDEAQPLEQPSRQTDPAKRKNAQKPRGAYDRPKKNPVVLERERRAREEEEQRKRKAELEKNRKTQHYHKRVKPKGPTKAVRIHNEEVAPVEDLRVEPTTLWGRFVKWLTSY
jgi:hypothetical protein